MIVQVYRPANSGFEDAFRNRTIKEDADLRYIGPVHNKRYGVSYQVRRSNALVFSDSRPEVLITGFSAEDIEESAKCLEDKLAISLVQQETTQ